MPYIMEWYIPDEVIFMAYYGKVTHQDMVDNLRDVVAMIEHSPRQSVHVICAMTAVTSQPTISEIVRAVRDVGVKPNTGWVVLYGVESMLVTVAADFATSVFKTRNRVVTDFTAATDLLQERDATISWDRADDFVFQKISQYGDTS